MVNQVVNPTVTPTPTPTATVSPTPSPTGGHGGHEIPEGYSMALHTWRVGGLNSPVEGFEYCEDGTDIVAAHMQYYVVAYDGLKYPTYHPPVVTNPITGVGKCYFGHEHGTNPTKYAFFTEIAQHFGKDINGDGVITPMLINSDTGVITEGDRAGLPFGIANEHMDQYYNQLNGDSVFVRHEDHVGHKIEFVDDEVDANTNLDGHITASTHQMTQLPGTRGFSVPYYTSGTNTFQHTGVSCSHLHKFHQGTHSADALLNNLHEVIFHSTCQSIATNGLNAPAFYPNNTIILTGMMSFGKPGVYKQFCGRKRDDNICGVTGVNMSTTSGATCTLTDPLLSRLPDAINSTSLGRNMTDVSCLQKVTQPGYGISDGSPYFTPYEIWDGDLAIYRGNTLTDSSMIAEHGRQWDVLDPVRSIDVGYQHPTRTWQKNYKFNSELCSTLLRGTNDYRTLLCNGGDREYNSRQSNFKGLKRTTYFGRNRIENQGGNTIYYTDPLGGNAVTTAAPALLKQYVSTVRADINRVQNHIQQVKGSNNFLNDRPIQRQFNSGSGTVRVPN